ncbi:hypothetical protein AVEN_266684-1 [Araneus ventricosus]|uniref:Uncharacterized protein n=1 Tax=Araneus ventricosus TaxID=182803 RepID=A0A4Y2RDT5_ARAVE|nr:hypothetical protein AVEN_238028-1 [Araneus ventricosus]GBN73922.1 hypothetical protein AVEN_266684-1 [Araneus ventricosus]
MQIALCRIRTLFEHLQARKPNTVLTKIVATLFVSELTSYHCVDMRLTWSLGCVLCRCVDMRLTWSLGCVLSSFHLNSPIVCRQERERVPEHMFHNMFWMRVENFFGVVCACADSDLFTRLPRMPLISPHFHCSTVYSLRFDWSAYEFE